MRYRVIYTRYAFAYDGIYLCIDASVDFIYLVQAGNKEKIGVGR